MDRIGRTTGVAFSVTHPGTTGVAFSVTHPGMPGVTECATGVHVTHPGMPGVTECATGVHVDRIGCTPKEVPNEIEIEDDDYATVNA